MRKKKQAKQRLSRKRNPQKAKPQNVPKFTFGRLRGNIQIVGDILSPVESADAWQYDINNIDKPRR